MKANTAKIWNSAPQVMKLAESITIAKKAINSYCKIITYLTVTIIPLVLLNFLIDKSIVYLRDYNKYIHDSAPSNPFTYLREIFKDTAFRASQYKILNKLLYVS